MDDIIISSNIRDSAYAMSKNFQRIYSQIVLLLITFHWQIDINIKTMICSNTDAIIVFSYRICLVEYLLDKLWSFVHSS